MAGLIGAALLQSTFPRQAGLDGEDLHECFLSDGKRLKQHRAILQIRRHDIHVLFVIHNIFRHKAMSAFDTALRKMTGVTEILAHLFASLAVFRAPTPYSRHHIVPHLDTPNGLTHFDHLAEGFMTRNEIVGPWGRRAVLELPDLAVGAADPDIEDFDLHIGRPEDPGLRLINKFDFFRFRKRGDRFHHGLLKKGLSDILPLVCVAVDSNITGLF
jgi:hypothetical protein